MIHPAVHLQVQERVCFIQTTMPCGADKNRESLRGGGLRVAMECDRGALVVKGRTGAGQAGKECGFLVGWATQRTIADQQKSAEDQRDGEPRRGRELGGLYGARWA